LEEKKSYERKEKMTHNQMLKKMIKEYLHFYFIKMIFALSSGHETHLYINHYIDVKHAYI